MTTDYVAVEYDEADVYEVIYQGYASATALLITLNHAHRFAPGSPSVCAVN